MNAQNTQSGHSRGMVRRLRNSYIHSILLSLAVLLSAIAAYSWMRAGDERLVLRRAVVADAERLTIALEQNLERARSHLYTMQRTVQQHIVDPTVGEDVMRRLDAVSAQSPPDSPWDRLSSEQTKTNAALFLHPQRPSDPQKLRQLKAAVVAMMPEVVAQHDVNPSLAWSYLYDCKESVFAVYPFVTRQQFLKNGGATDMNAMMQTLFHADGTLPVQAAGPLRNPQRKTLWTVPYLDASGAGMMVTLLAPVYQADECVAITAIDITLKMINTVMSQYTVRLGRAVLVDPSGVVVADSNNTLANANRRVNLKELFPNQTAGLIHALHTNTEAMSDPEWIRLPIQGNDWSLLIHLPETVVREKLWQAGQSYLLMAFGLLVWAILLAWYQTQRLVRPAWQLVDYMDQLDERASAEAPKVPPAWHHWFERASMAARERGELLDTSKQYAHQLEQRVAEARLTTQALERQHRMLEAVRQTQAAFIQADDKRQSFEDLLAAFLAVTDSAYGFMAEVSYDETDTPYLKIHAITDIAWDEPTRRLMAEKIEDGLEFRNTVTMLGHALLTGKTVVVNDPANGERLGSLPLGHPDLSAFLGVPLTVGNRLVAMIFLANRAGGYSEQDVTFFQPLLGTARQLVLAWRAHIESSRARQQLQATSALLADKSAALQVTLDSMIQGLTKVDADGQITIYNHRMLELLDLPDALMAQYPTHEMLVRFQTERGDFGANMELVEPAARAYFGPLPVPTPEQYFRKTPSGRTLEVTTRSLPQGGMVRTYTDVSSYIQAEEALRDQRQRLEWVLEATGPGIWEVNITTGETTYSQRWASLLGYEPHELMPTTLDTWRRLLHPQDRQRADELMQQHWRGESPHYACDLRMRHKQGHWLWFNDRGRVHRRGEQGRALYMSGTLLDIHERVTAQEEVRALNASLERRVAERTAELESSMKDMEAISYSIAHDLRAPLRSVNGFASLIAESEEANLSSEGRKMFGRIARSSRNMGQMISDMLELLRVVRVAITAVPVDMHALAQTVTEALAPAVPHAQIDIGLLPIAQGDAKLLQQVLTNLIDNALKYSSHLQAPHVRLGFDTQVGAFFLRDNGMGFDMAHADRLFGLFQRLHTGADVPGGTGVGLAIVARTLERHGGRIWAESAPGKGATFWWTLPLA